MFIHFEHEFKCISDLWITLIYSFAVKRRRRKNNFLTKTGKREYPPNNRWIVHCHFRNYLLDFWYNLKWENLKTQIHVLLGAIYFLLIIGLLKTWHGTGIVHVFKQCFFLKLKMRAIDKLMGSFKAHVLLCANCALFLFHYSLELIRHRKSNFDTYIYIHLPINGKKLFFSRYFTWENSIVLFAEM